MTPATLIPVDPRNLSLLWASPERVPDIAVGAFAPTPIMRWLLGRGGAIDGFHQAMLLQVPAGLRQEHLAGALQALLDHHDGLRLRLVGPSGQGTGQAGDDWHLEVSAVGTVSAAQCLRRVDVGGFDQTTLRACLSEQAQLAISELAPREGEMVRAVWFDAGPAAAGRLLLVIHHLAVDGVSWRILLPDLEAAYTAIAQGHRVSLAAPGTSMRRWSQRLAAEAQAERRLGEVAFWSAMLSRPSLSLYDGMLDPGRDVAGTAGRKRPRHLVRHIAQPVRRPAHLLHRRRRQHVGLGEGPRHRRLRHAGFPGDEADVWGLGRGLVTWLSLRQRRSS